MVKDQPRINNIKNLLQVAIQHQDGNASTETSTNQQNDQINQERREFLESALRSITVDHADVLKNQIAKLNELVERLNSKTPLSDEESDHYCEILEEIVEDVSNIDFANDFYKLNGFKPLTELIDCELITFKIPALNVLAELVQNNEFAQEKAVYEFDYLNKLNNLIKGEKNELVLLKGVYALSTLLRGHDRILNDFLRQDDNIRALLEAMMNFKVNEKIIFKISFLLNSICGLKNELYDTLNRLNFVLLATSLMKENPQTSHEYLLAVLVGLVENLSQAKEESWKNNLKPILEEKIKLFKNKDEYLEEVDYCNRLKELLN